VALKRFNAWDEEELEALTSELAGYEAARELHAGRVCAAPAGHDEGNRAAPSAWCCSAAGPRPTTEVS